ncbi:hypothetical protein K443DRAFT_220844 [Laccaria amethystina LaAM-08-1]|jgi:hypothetical protein|uniref:Uncharacterized protein n=1 Tax=Laccaria amethystina LaAM-08-1 TaxID=1095629 RepID=A0A0C9XQ59_9AGAR|nr:hypothetical protein K443DRAFT_220844 [Laccaria amethystina LaAM-08-1]
MPTTAVNWEVVVPHSSWDRFGIYLLPCNVLGQIVFHPWLRDCFLAYFQLCLEHSTSQVQSNDLVTPIQRARLDFKKKKKGILENLDISSDCRWSTDAPISWDEHMHAKWNDFDKLARLLGAYCAVVLTHAYFKEKVFHTAVYHQYQSNLALHRTMKAAYKDRFPAFLWFNLRSP